MAVHAMVGAAIKAPSVAVRNRNYAPFVLGSMNNIVSR